MRLCSLIFFYFILPETDMAWYISKVVTTPRRRFKFPLQSTGDETEDDGEFMDRVEDEPFRCITCHSAWVSGCEDPIATQEPVARCPGDVRRCYTRYLPGEAPLVERGCLDRTVLRMNAACVTDFCNAGISFQNFSESQTDLNTWRSHMIELKRFIKSQATLLCISCHTNPKTVVDLPSDPCWNIPKERFLSMVVSCNAGEVCAARWAAGARRAWRGCARAAEHTLLTTCSRDLCNVAGVDDSPYLVPVDISAALGSARTPWLLMLILCIVNFG